MFSNATIEQSGRAPGIARRAAELVARASFASLSSAIVLLSLVLLSPALFTGMVADDYLHQLLLRDDPGVRGLDPSSLDLFRFVDANPKARLALIEEGLFPWWADPETRISFFRPLSSALHALDHSVWPASPFLMHLHSLAWFGALLGIVGALYRRIAHSSLFAAFCLLLFAFDDAHAPVAGWIANRNAIIAASFALLGVLCFHLYRSEGRRLYAWLGPLCFCLGLLAGETAFTAAGYLLSYAVYMDRDSWRSRVAALAPYAATILIWKLVNVLLGYGVTGSGVYIDPLNSPVEFVSALCERLPVLALALFAAPFADLWEVYPLTVPAIRPVILLSAAVVLGLLGFALRPVWKKDPAVRFWALGSLFALLPVCATFPHDRLLLVPGVGAMAVIAALLQSAWQRRQHGMVALGGAALVCFHLVLAPVLLPLRAASIDGFDKLLRTAERTLPSGPATLGQTLVLVNPPLDPFAAYLPIFREAMGMPRPRQQLYLATGRSELQITTLDSHRLELRPEGGFLSAASEQMLRKAGSGPRVGERIELDGLQLLVTQSTADGRPQTVVVEFETPMSDPRWVWMRWEDTGYGSFQLPPKGQTTTLPQADLAKLLLGIGSKG